MIKITLYIAIALFMTASIAWLADHPGSVMIEFRNFEIHTSVAALAFLAGLIIALSITLVYGWIWLKTDAPIIGRNRVYKRQRQGFDYLNQSMIALAAGDANRARQLIKSAELLLPPQPMVQLIAAEAATRSGDHSAAARYYHSLEKDEKARFLGLRGLIGEAKRTGQMVQALKLAREALGENKKSNWAMETVFQLEIASGDWASAQVTLTKSRSVGLFDESQTKSHMAALLHAEAIELLLAGNDIDARKNLIRALKERIGFVAAANQLARMEKETGNQKKAEKILSDAYRHNPHPELVATLLNFNTTLTDKEWGDKLKNFTQTAKDHPVTLYALSEAELARDHPKEANFYIDKLIEIRPTRSAWRLKAHLIDIDGGDSQQARDKSNNAQPDSSWECDSCGQNYTKWMAICPVCESFNSISWGDHSYKETNGRQKSQPTNTPVSFLEGSKAI